MVNQNTLNQNSIMKPKHELLNLTLFLLKIKIHIPFYCFILHNIVRHSRQNVTYRLLSFSNLALISK